MISPKNWTKTLKVCFLPSCLPVWVWQAMNISVTTLKRLCRRHGVKRWPHRQISGINRAMAHLEFQQDQAGRRVDGPGGVRMNTQVSDQMQELLRRRRVMIEVREATRAIYYFTGDHSKIGPTVQTKTYIFTYFYNNIWSFLLWSPVIPSWTEI